MNDTNSPFVTGALLRLAHYTDDNILRTYIRIGAQVIEAQATAAGVNPPGNLDDLILISNTIKKGFNNANTN